MPKTTDARPKFWHFRNVIIRPGDLLQSRIDPSGPWTDHVELKTFEGLMRAVRLIRDHPGRYRIYRPGVNRPGYSSIGRVGCELVS